MEVHFYQKVLLIFDFSDTLIQMLLENKKKKIRIFITNEACTFLSVENDNVKYLICIRELQKKKRKSSKIIIDSMGKLYCNIKIIEKSITNR